MKRIIMHIDVNNAFLSWTAIDLLEKGYKKDIRNEYAVIGGDESRRHGIVLAKSPLTKEKGIITGEALYFARKKCPELKVYPPNYKLYEEKSNSLFKLLSNYTPDIEILSIDECFLDYGKVKKLYGDELEFARKIQQEIYDKLKFTVNIGIANNKLCAKMASDFSKPNKIHTLYDYEVKEKLWPLKVGDLYGIGKKTAEVLNKINIKTIEELATANINILKKYFKNQAAKMIDAANGIDDSEVDISVNDPKGIGTSTTLPYDYVDKEEIYKVIDLLVDKVTLSLRSQQKYASVVVVTIKDRYFKTYSHQTKLKNATSITDEINKTAKSLFDEMWDEEPIRLIGVRLDQLTDNCYYQVSLFEDITDRDKSNKLDKVIDSINSKFGKKVLKSANLINKKIDKH